MSNDNGQNSSTDLGKGLISTGKQGARVLRNSKAVAKLLRGILGNFVRSLVVWLAGLAGSYILLIFILIILLLIVIQSVISFDIFQRGNERNQAEVIFDETIKDVFEQRLEVGPSKVRAALTESQPKNMPSISSTWLYQTGEMLKQSIAVPTIHHYFKNIENDNYKPWHKEYSHLSASDPEKLREKFRKIIDKEFDYYFEGSTTFEPEYTYEKPPFQEYIKTTKRKKCPEQKTKVTEDIEKINRKIIKKAKIGYLEGTIPYKEYHDYEYDSYESGDCSISITIEKKFYIIDDQRPMTVDFSPERLVEILTLTSNEGARTRLVQAQDLEYAIVLGREMDERFPSPKIDYAGLIACAKKNRTIANCIGTYTHGGSLGSIGIVTGWYPKEYEAIYKKSADACGIDWTVLAAVHKEETSFSTNPVATDPSKGSFNSRGELVGAVGHFQFMPLSWVGWNARKDYPTTDKGAIIGDISWIIIPENIKKYGGHGKDGNNDGVASPWDLEDAALSAACYLKHIGYEKGNETSIKRALAKYNGGNNPGAAAYAYADRVWQNAMLYKQVSENAISIAPGNITYPTVGRITSHHGWRNLGYGPEFHAGLDIANAVGTPIVAIADGTVEVVDATGTATTWGKYVRIVHNIDGETFYSLYAHMSQTLVKPGDKVNKGTTIGLMGMTGRVTGPHLHLEIHRPPWNWPSSSMNPLLVIPPPPAK